jgi:hypothetical protein
MIRRAAALALIAFLPTVPGIAQTVNFAQPTAGGAAAQSNQNGLTQPTQYSPTLQSVVMPSLAQVGAGQQPAAGANAVQNLRAVEAGMQNGQAAGGAPPGLPMPPNPQALSNFPQQGPLVPTITALDRALVPLQQRESAWSSSRLAKAADQDQPGFKVVPYRPGMITRVVTRPAAPFTVILPSWERIAFVFPGPQYYSPLQITPNTVEIRTNNFDYNAPLKILGQSGNLYVFMIDCVSIDKLKESSDLVVQVQANADPGAVAMPASAPAVLASAVATPALPSSGGFPTDIPVPEEAKGLVSDPASVAVPHILFERSPGDRDRIGPVRVWEDKNFTYLDFGDDSYLKPRPAISLLSDDVATRAVNPYEDPAHRRFVILDRKGSFTLRTGQSVVCIIRTTDPRAGLRPVPVRTDAADGTGLFQRLFGGAS